ncbi:AAA family ATPase (plasmid) [Halococcus dombrowskii]|uniref:AAA family ATPase n=1 Tax=Halococcus dombrowskii TaxID=179637 RepID=A0AAV3SCY3_HALDO|nr:AAA family ATPase [Halococcus dombrowskii]UOO96911.1 AAA family ATPase [Halococcus dombrowskii]
MSQLEIRSLTLENYRQYAGENEIQLQTQSDKSVNVIQGENGAGKSNILNAITLCLYGKESHYDETKDNELESYPYVNRGVLDEVGDNEIAEGRIEITLGEDEPEYIFSRSFRTVKLNSSSFSSQHGELQLKEKRGGDWKSVEHVSTRLNQILPVHVHQYFLFDGERLDEFFGEGYKNRVKNGLLDVSHIELLERGISHLRSFEDDSEKELSDVGDAAERKRDEYEKAKERINDLESDLEQTKTNISETKNHIQKIDEKLQDSANPEVRKKQQRREYLIERLEDIRDDIEEVRKEASRELVKSGPPLYAVESLDFTLSEVRKLSEQGKLPPKIQDTFIEELLEEGQCICGEELTEEHREHLISLQQEMSTVVENNLEGKMAIPGLLQDAHEDAETLMEKRRKLAELEDKEQRKNKELNEISEQLKAHDIPEDVDVQELEKQRTEYEDQLEELQEGKGKLEVRIDQAKENRDEKKKAFNEEVSKEEKNAEILKKMQFIGSSRDELESMKEDIISSVREEIETKMNNYFNEIIWKNEDYTVTLTDEYQVRVEGPRNDNKIGSLSAGERQVLAFSFLAALTSVSGFNAPLVIDTPLGRISSTPKRRLAQNLPEYIDDTQMTFLMTDEEYTDEVRMKMKSHVSNEYKLEFVDEVTEVVPYE